MVQILNDPKFPVIDDRPTARKVVNAFRPVDWRNLVLATVVTMPLGYAAGRPILMRETMYASGGISALFGFLLGWEKSYARLMGYRENEPEQKKFGVPSSASTSTADGSMAEASNTGSSEATIAASVKS